MTNRSTMLALLPCKDGLARAAESPTLREWWGTAANSGDMMWLVGKAHSRGTLPRRGLVLVAVRCAETCAHLMPDEALPHLATVSSWANGADDITVQDLCEARNALWSVRAAAYDAAAGTVSAAAYAYAAAYAAAAAAYAYDAAAAYAAAAAAAADAATFTAAAYAAYDAMCDVIRDAITIDVVCAALGLDPEQGV